MGELDLIKWIKENTKSGKPVLVGVGDDSAVIDISKNKSLIISTDTLLDGTHFRQNDCTPKLIGQKAIASSISDIGAMGCKPNYALVSISFPEETDESYCKEIFRGVISTSHKYGMQIIGGDVVSGNCPLNINITVIGTSISGKTVKRSGAKVNDVIIVTGDLGGSILGKHLMFEPRVFEGVKLNERFNVNSMIDISDGLLIDLFHILEESNLGAVIDEQTIPISSDAYKLSRKTKKSPLCHALTDGEDYELLFTVNETTAYKILNTSELSVNLTRIGRIRKEKGLYIKDLNGKEQFVEPRGYEHLK